MIKYIASLFFIPFLLFGKTLVVTTAFNRPDFIHLQHRLFEKFLEDDYEFFVISDASNEDMQQKIKSTCESLSITCYQVPQGIHDKPYLPRSTEDNYNNPNIRHCNSVQWAWDHFFSKHDGPVMIIDSDMFLIRPFSVEQRLKNKHLAGVMWGTDDMITGAPYSYMWLALILLNNEFLPDRETLCFNCGVLPGTQAICDSGGWTNLYLSRFKELNIDYLSYLQGHQFFCPYRYASMNCQNFDHVGEQEIIENLTLRKFTENEIKLALKKPYTIELLGDNHFLHYRAGSNYENYSDDFISSKDKILLEFFESILAI